MRKKSIVKISNNDFLFCNSKVGRDRRVCFPCRLGSWNIWRAECPRQGREYLQGVLSWCWHRLWCMCREQHLHHHSKLLISTTFLITDLLMWLSAAATYLNRVLARRHDENLFSDREFHVWKLGDIDTRHLRRAAARRIKNIKFKLRN